MSSRPSAPLLTNDDRTMFRWPEKLTTVALAYGLVFVGFPVLCVLSYLWVTGAF